MSLYTQHCVPFSPEDKEKHCVLRKFFEGYFVF